MQPSIASFFQKANSTSSGRESASAHKNNKKRKALIISSDEEEVDKSSNANGAPGTPVSKKLRTAKEKESTDLASVSSKTSSNKPQLSKLKNGRDNAKISLQKERKAVDPMVFFEGEAKRVQVAKTEKSKNLSLLVFEDDEIEQSMMEIADETIISKTKLLPEDEGISLPSKKKTKQSPKNEISSPNAVNDVLSDEERYERKRVSAILYQKYKNRSTVINPGCKEVPTGKPNCLAGLSFLVTGILESLEREEINELVKQYGGKVMSTVGKRLNYLIVGEEAGPKKVAQATDYGIKIISEDDFLNLIRQSSDNTESKESLKSPGNKNRSPHKIKQDNSPLSPKNNNMKIKDQLSPTIKRSPQKRSFSENIKEEKLESLSNKQPKVENRSSPKKHSPQTIKIKTENLESIDQKISQTMVTIKTDIPENMVAWVDKYKPTTIKDIVGQQGAASNVVKLKNWLSNWYQNHNGKKKLVKPNPWAKNDDGSYYKAALLSGPPGIGKTTTATLVSRELGFDIVEMNASDTRSKRLLQEEVSSLLSSKSLFGYFNGVKGNQAVSKKHVLLMDEVDGMAGNEDRGGIQELIGLIKNSSVPIICMCNDRNHQKMRSLVNYCYDLRFNRPNLKQIKSCIMSICSRERVKLDPTKIDEIIEATNNDIRQSINHVSLLSAGKKVELSNSEKTLNNASTQTAAKDLKIGPWEVVRKVFSLEEHQKMSLNNKYDLFFYDYSLGPLFIQQNYLIVSPAGSRLEVMNKVAKTADALSLGDLIDKRIRTQSAWSMLPTQATFSSVLPGEYMKGYVTGQINFPLWLGKNSHTTKRLRLAQEIHDHTRIRTSGSRISVHLDYAKFLLNKIVGPLQSKGLDGVDESLNVLKEYHLLREDIDSLIELTSYPGKKSPLEAIEGKIKAALTRAYNKEVLAYSYSAQDSIKKKRMEVEDDLLIDGMAEEETESGTLNSNNSDKESDDNLENDTLIKIKKKSSAGTASSKSSATTKKKPAIKGSSKSKK